MPNRNLLIPGTKAATALRGIIPGLIVLAVGVLFLLHNLDVVRFGEVRIYWPLLLIAGGVHWALDPKSRAVGIVAVLAGVAFQASNLGYIKIGDLFHFWPLILVAFGVHLLLQERAHKQGEWMTGALVLTLGMIFQLQELHLFGASIWRLWPLLVIVAGFAMLQKALRSRRASH
jgi:hypothetical protein